MAFGSNDSRYCKSKDETTYMNNDDYASSSPSFYVMNINLLQYLPRLMPHFHSTCSLCAFKIHSNGSSSRYLHSETTITYIYHHTNRMCQTFKRRRPREWIASCTIWSSNNASLDLLRTRRIFKRLLGRKSHIATWTTNILFSELLYIAYSTMRESTFHILWYW